MYFGRSRARARYREIAPTLRVMLMPLSFKITTIGSRLMPALFSPSEANPPVKAPSPSSAAT